MFSWPFYIRYTRRSVQNLSKTICNGLMRTYLVFFFLKEKHQKRTVNDTKVHFLRVAKLESFISYYKDNDFEFHQIWVMYWDQKREITMYLNLVKPVYCTPVINIKHNIFKTSSFLKNYHTPILKRSSDWKKFNESCISIMK